MVPGAGSAFGVVAAHVAQPVRYCLGLGLEVVGCCVRGNGRQQGPRMLEALGYQRVIDSTPFREQAVI